MKKTIYIAFLLIYNILSAQFSAGKSAQFYEPLPNNIKLEFSASQKLFGDKNSIETDLYWFEINSFPFMMIKTDNIPDCILIADNSFGGGDLYKKLDDDRYQRIVEVRDHKDFFAIYFVDNNNESKKLMEVSKTEAKSSIIPLLYGYSFYWKKTIEK